MSSEEEEFDFNEPVRDKPVTADDNGGMKRKVSTISEPEENNGNKVEEESDESDDDDIPLAQLISTPKKKKKKDDDDIPLAQLVPSSKKENDDDDDDDDEDDDDIPLSQLISSSKKKKKKDTSSSKSTKTVAKKKTATPTKTPDTTKSSTNKPIVFKTVANALFDSGCAKALLIQHLLCRWWYVVDWPRNIPPVPPKHYDAMDGLPGVFVCTSGGDAGKIKDFRSKHDMPTFTNFLKKEAKDLKVMLLKAIEEQAKILVETEGEGTPTQKELNEIVKWAKKINVDKAEKEAIKVLKKAKIELF